MYLQVKIWLLIWFYKNLNGYYNISTKLLYAQALHETGKFTSAVFKQNKNLFGMRQPTKRKTTATGSNLGHATYTSHRKAIIDYFIRQKYSKIFNTNDNRYVVDTVRSGYAEDKLYAVKWQRIKENTKVPFFVHLLAYGGLFFLLLVVFITIFKGERNNRRNNIKR
ncbi:glucosaminidase domain-containing protein [Changchengzhania lutea]|uniref:glucosaminidase domain-containing protein n=1 Tax=Changchengzhania lutea TaxID=2049305 RepID=UPI00115C7FAA|nr:glucosaminidase domain-containing protein [Changchengzhania lutea]